MVEDVAMMLKERGGMLAVAESCTGGRVAAAFTATAGASEYFSGGVIAYADEVKINVLGVDPETLERHGAVSREVAEQMAAGVLRITGADLAVATTGIAGPGGGTPEKPVGTVWVATAVKDAGTGGDSTEKNVRARRFHFDGTRTGNMARATAAAIEMLRASLM